MQVATSFRVLNAFCSSKCVLPTYTPSLDKNVGVNRDNLIRSYFLQGFTNAEIAGFLALHHGIILSVRTVKRILKRLKLRRVKCNNKSPLEEILEELEVSCGSFMGYCQLTRHLRRKYNLQVKRDTVMKFVRIIDAEGVECRKRRRLVGAAEHSLRTIQCEGQSYPWGSLKATRFPLQR